MTDRPLSADPVTDAWEKWLRERRPGYYSPWECFSVGYAAARAETDRLHAQLLEHAEVCGESAYPLSDRKVDVR